MQPLKEPRRPVLCADHLLRQVDLLGPGDQRRGVISGRQHRLQRVHRQLSVTTLAEFLKQGPNPVVVDFPVRMDILRRRHPLAFRQEPFPHRLASLFRVPELATLPAIIIISPQGRAG